MHKMIVIKRNGAKQAFNGYKIYNAIYRAIRSSYPDENKVGDSILTKSYGEIINRLQSYNELNVEDIQNIIVDVLKTVDKITFKSFNDYRNRRKVVRDRLKGGMDGVNYNM